MSLDDLHLRTKLGFPVAVMAAVILAMAAFGALNVKRLAAALDELMDVNVQGEIAVFRARTDIVAIGYTLMSDLVLVDADKDNTSAGMTFSKSISAGLARLDEAAALLPQRAVELAELKAHMQRIAQAAQEPFRLAHETPSLTRGSALKPRRA